MSIEYSFTPDNKVIGNIKSLSSKQSMLEERRMSELSELAYSAAESARELNSAGMNITEILSLLSDSLDFSETEIHDDYLEDNITRLRGHAFSLSMLDKEYFSVLLFERLSSIGINVKEEDFLPSASVNETFVYVKNSFADEAYDVFSQDFTDPRVAYAANIKEAVSMLLDGIADHCLLPLEDRGSRIRTVDELIFKGDLKINSVIPVFGLDGNADMKYCLVSKNYRISSYTNEDDRYLELRIPKDGKSSFSELISVAEGLGFETYRVNSELLSIDEGERAYFSLVFKSSGVSFVSLLVYLTLFTEDFTTLGIYKNLE